MRFSQSPGMAGVGRDSKAHPVPQAGTAPTIPGCSKPRPASSGTLPGLTLPCSRAFLGMKAVCFVVFWDGETLQSSWVTPLLRVHQRSSSGRGESQKHLQVVTQPRCHRVLPATSLPTNPLLEAGESCFPKHLGLHQARSLSALPNPGNLPKTSSSRCWPDLIPRAELPGSSLVAHRALWGRREGSEFLPSSRMWAGEASPKY